VILTALIILFLTVAGDQSILMKYANPHTVLLTYFSSEKGAQRTEAPLKDEGESLYAALVDTVSNKILYRILLSKTASKPVHTLLETHGVVFLCALRRDGRRLRPLPPVFLLRTAPADQGRRPLLLHLPAAPRDSAHVRHTPHGDIVAPHSNQQR
jgi:hypothetical protein